MNPMASARSPGESETDEEHRFLQQYLRIRPAAFAWCGHGVFSVAVSAVTGSPEATVTAATDEVAAVVAAQLDRLPD